MNLPITEDQANKIDKILNHILNKKGSLFISKDVSEKLNLNLLETNDLYRIIIEEIYFEGNHIVFFMNLNIIKSTYNTEKFIKSGGCIGFYNNLISEKEKEEERQNLELLNLKNSIESFKITKKQYYWTLAFAVAGVLLGLTGIIIQILNKS